MILPIRSLRTVAGNGKWGDDLFSTGTTTYPGAPEEQSLRLRGRGALLQFRRNEATVLGWFYFSVAERLHRENL